jgi:hypothetical protein
MSIPITDCFQNILGITRKPCPCVDDENIPTDYDISLSGLYIDELRGIDLIMIDKAGNCTDLWDTVQRCYDQATKKYTVDFMNAFFQENRLKFRAFSGNIGNFKSKSNAAISQKFAGMRIYCNDVKDGKLIIEDVGVIFGDTNLVNISLYSSEDLSTPIKTWSITPQANKPTFSNANSYVELPLTGQYIDNVEYFLLYEAAGHTPKDNTIGCGCAGVRWCFNTANPCFAIPGAHKDAWRQFAMIGGTQGADIEEATDWGAAINANGLIIKAQFVCNPTSLYCNDTMDFINDPVAIGIAFALFYKTGELICDHILASKEINRYTLSGREGIELNRAFYMEKYNEMISYVTKAINPDYTGCVMCDDRWGIQKQGVLI